MTTWKNPLPGVPLIESPFFDEWLAQSGLDEETRRIAIDLRRDGYAVFDFPADDFDDLADRARDDVGDMREGHLQTDARTGIRPLVLDMAYGVRVQDAWAQSQAVRDIACNPRILELLRILYGRRGWPFQTLNFSCGTQQPYHSDSVHFSTVPERFMCGVWVAFEDIDGDNGPLVYYPGSHQWPIYGNEHVGHWAEDAGTRNQETHRELWNRGVKAFGLERKQFRARRGQALLWMANLLHGGDTQLDPKRTRWSQVTHYYFDDCAYVTPVFSDPIYGRWFYRNPIDLTTGQRVENRYLGRTIPQEVIDRAAARGSLEDKLQRFDEKQYLLANPDVKKAGVDPRQHYIEHGFKEGRPLTPAQM
ncbi:MAG: phytanoyl-CoA dioxygenase family protein [Planctomycetota bacterium]